MVILPMAKINLHRILIGIGNSANILFFGAWKAIKLTHPLSTTSLVGFLKASMNPDGYVTLPITIR